MKYDWNVNVRVLIFNERLVLFPANFYFYAFTFYKEHFLNLNLVQIKLLQIIDLVQQLKSFKSIQFDQNGSIQQQWKRFSFKFPQTVCRLLLSASTVLSRASQLLSCALQCWAVWQNSTIPQSISTFAVQKDSPRRSVPQRSAFCAELFSKPL